MYKHQSELLREFKDATILWDFAFHTDEKKLDQ